MIELPECQELIDPLKEALIGAHLEGFRLCQEIFTKNPGFAAPLTSSEKKAIIHQHVCNEVGNRLPQGMALTDKPGFWALTVNDRLLVRFKCLNDGAPRSYATGQQRRLDRQEFTQEMLSGLNLNVPPTFVTAGYTTADDWSEIARVLVRRDCVGHLPWSFDIYPSEAVEEPLAFPGIADVEPAVVSSTREEVAQTTDDAEESS